MKRAILGVLALGAALLGSVEARQGDQQDKFRQNYEKALEAEFIEYGGWVTDYDVARERAKKEGKLIFAFFSRSYAP